MSFTKTPGLPKLFTRTIRVISHSEKTTHELEVPLLREKVESGDIEV
jgi:hypothetical protein